jgi:uncharacterized protein (TIGR02246 family)
MNWEIDRVRMVWLPALIVLSAGCRLAGKETTSVDTRVIEDSLRAMVIRSFEGIEAKDADKALALMSDDVIFVGDGLMMVGKDSLLRLTTRSFSEWKSVDADVEIVRVQVLSPEAAVVNWKAHVDATDAKGVHTPYGGIATAVFVLRGGRWQIIQQQQCAPMPPEVPSDMKPSSRAIPES